MPKQVLLAIDWSESAEKAFDWYIYHLHRKGCKLILSHYIEADKEKEYMKKEAAMHELQETYEDRLMQMGIQYEWITGSNSSPGEHLVTLSKDSGVDMIVMGARGLNKLQKVFMGSVSDYVLRNATCPVLICRSGTADNCPQVLKGAPVTFEDECPSFTSLLHDMSTKE